MYRDKLLVSSTNQGPDDDNDDDKTTTSFTKEFLQNTLDGLVDIDHCRTASGLRIDVSFSDTETFKEIAQKGIKYQDKILQAIVPYPTNMTITKLSLRGLRLTTDGSLLQAAFAPYGTPLEAGIYTVHNTTQKIRASMGEGYILVDRTNNSLDIPSIVTYPGLANLSVRTVVDTQRGTPEATRLNKPTTTTTASNQPTSNTRSKWKKSKDSQDHPQDDDSAPSDPIPTARKPKGTKRSNRGRPMNPNAMDMEIDKDNVQCFSEQSNGPLSKLPPSASDILTSPTHISSLSPEQGKLDSGESETSDYESTMECEEEL
ncbi:hypothetical protein BGZ94_005307 [Podila epigama]|nr:hypothetical protein BGZ94_005307 [Podila epigama]